MTTLKLHHGDCLNVLDLMEENSVDAVVTDPPYELGFMGKSWDASGIAFNPETWRKVMRVLKPGGHIVAFGAPKNYHRLACAIEDAGFEVRDSLMWVFGQGFPKSANISKHIDKTLGVEGTYGEPKSAAHAGWIDRGKMRGDEGHEGFQRPWMQDVEAVDKAARKYEGGSENARAWDGWGTALKPSYEPIILARKPLSEKTVAANVLKWGCGALNIDSCRVETDDNLNGGAYARDGNRQSMSGDDRKGAALGMFQPGKTAETEYQQPAGRWPANLCHDGSQEVVDLFPNTKSGVAVQRNGGGQKIGGNGIYSGSNGLTREDIGYNDEGSAARFFYCAKANKHDRAGSKHPTVKPVSLMRWLVRMVTPTGGIILDPFAGSGTTGQAAIEEGFNPVLIERENEYVQDIQNRMKDKCDVELIV